MLKVRCEACGHTDCKGWQEGQPVHEYRGKGNWHFGCHCDGCTRARNESGGFVGALADHLAGSTQTNVEPDKWPVGEAEVVIYDPDADLIGARGPRKIIDASIGFMRTAQVGERLYTKAQVEEILRATPLASQPYMQRDQVITLEAERNLFKGKYRALLKLISRTRNKLVHVTDHIQDEGDRRYFGSSNDADELLDLFHTMDAWVWDAVDKTNRMKSDPYADIREQRARADKAEAEIRQLRKIISDSATALGTGAFIAPQASIEFMEGLPKEISLVVAGLRASSTAPQMGDVAHG